MKKLPRNTIVRDKTALPVDVTRNAVKTLPPLLNLPSYATIANVYFMGKIVTRRTRKARNLYVQSWRNAWNVVKCLNTQNNIPVTMSPVRTVGNSNTFIIDALSSPIP